MQATANALAMCATSDPGRGTAPPFVQTVGNVSERDLVIWRAKYGDSLMAVRDIESVPDLRERYAKQDTHIYITQGLREGLDNAEIVAEEMPAIAGLYHQHADGMPFFDYDPERSFITVPRGEGVTHALAAQMQTQFGMTADEIARLSASIAQLRAAKDRADSQIPIQILKRTAAHKAGTSPPLVHKVYDSTSNVTVYALAARVIPSDVTRSATVIRETARVLGAALRADYPKLAAHRTFLHCAWVDTGRATLYFYASFDTPRGYEREEDDYARMLAQALANMELREDRRLAAQQLGVHAAAAAAQSVPPPADFS